MHHILIKDDPKRAWSASAGAGDSDYERIVSAPIVAEGRVYTMDARSRVSAFDAAKGDRLWRVSLAPKSEDEGHIGGGLAYAYGRVYATTGFAQAIALNAKDGQEVWRQPIPGPMRTPPTVHGGRVFVVTVDNQVFALDAETGAQQWNFAGITESASILGGGSPAVDSGVAVVPFSSGELVALKVENGRVLWSDSLATARRTDQVSTLSHVRGRPVIDRGRVFALSHGGIMVAIDLRTGRRLWDRQIGGLESPWVAGDYIYVLTGDSEIVSLSRNDGRIYWIQELPRFEDAKKKKNPIQWTGPVLASDRLIIAGSHGFAVAVSPYDGSILGTEKMPDGVTVPPVVAGGSVYFLANDADLVAYR
jgi:outer membrane protein assembly factor BamB